MKKSRYTEEQIAFALKQAELGTPVEDVCRKLGIAEQTFYRWKKRYAGQPLLGGHLNTLKERLIVYSKRKKIAILIIIFVILLFSSFVVSTSLFYSRNPFMTGYGVIRITCTDQSYVIIDKNPKVYLAKSKNAYDNLRKMMKDDRYSYNANKRLGDFLDFEKDGKDQVVLFIAHKYYSIWVFEKS